MAFTSHDYVFRLLISFVTIILHLLGDAMLLSRFVSLSAEKSRAVI